MSTARRASLSIIQSKSSLIEQEDEVSKTTTTHPNNKTIKRIRPLRLVVDPQKLELKNVFSEEQNVSTPIEMDDLVLSLVSAIKCTKNESLSRLQFSDIDDHKIATNQKMNYYKKKKKKPLCKKYKSVPIPTFDTEMYGQPTPTLAKKCKTVNISSSADHKLNVINELEQVRIPPVIAFAQYGKSQSAPFPIKQSNLNSKYLLTQIYASVSPKPQLEKRRKKRKNVTANVLHHWGTF